MTEFISEYDYIAAMLRHLISNADLKSKVDAFHIDLPMSNIREALKTKKTIVGISIVHHYTKGSWGSAISKITENKAIVQIDIVSQKGSNSKYAREIASYIKDLLYLCVDLTLDGNKYQIYNDHIDTDLVEYNTDYGAWHVVLSVYMEYWRVAP